MTSAPPIAMPSPTLLFQRTHLNPGTRVGVALSGGADSVALLRALHAANLRPHDSLGIGLSAVHIHHGVRSQDADQDQRFVTALCARLDLPLVIRAVDTPGFAAATGQTLEEAARTLRYRAFSELLGSGAVDVIATAHTLNDQAETVLMKLLRGAWTEGLGGIAPVLEIRLPPPQSPARVVRPLLQTSRAAVEAFLTALDQPWREDQSNRDPAYTRNRVRHELLPALRAFNPALDETLADLAEIARDEEAHWQIDLSRLLPQLLLPGKPVRGGGRSVSTAPAGESAGALALEIERLRPLSTATRRRVLRAAARQLGCRLNFAETGRLEALCGFRALATVPSRPGAVLHMSGGLRAERSARELRLSRILAPSAVPPD